MNGCLWYQELSILKHLDTDFVSLCALVLISFITHFLAELIYLLILKLLAVIKPWRRSPTSSTLTLGFNTLYE